MNQIIHTLASLVRHALKSWHHTARFCLVLVVAGAVFAGLTAAGSI